MKIEIEKSGDNFRADCKDLPGMPPVGIGKTPEEAVAWLCWFLLFDNTGGEYPEPWSRYIKESDPIVLTYK